MRLLAQDLALGGSACTWARRKGVNELTALGGPSYPSSANSSKSAEWSTLSELVGKIASCVERAIDRLVELSEKADTPNVGLAATKAIIETVGRTFGVLRARAEV